MQKSLHPLGLSEASKTTFHALNVARGNWFYWAAVRGRYSFLPLVSRSRPRHHDSNKG